MGKALSNKTKLNHVIDLKADHGAKGDGTTDDSAAVQAFFDEVTTKGYKGEMPEGVFLINTGVYVTLRAKGFSLKGAGTESTIFRVTGAFTGATPAITVQGGASATFPGFEIGGFSVRAEGGYGACTAGFKVGNTGTSNPTATGFQQRTVRDVFTADIPIGFDVVHARLVRFNNCAVWNNNLGVANTCLKISQNGLNAGDLLFDKCQFVTSTAAGNKAVYMASLDGPYNISNGNGSVSGIKFRSCDFYAGGKAIHIYATDQSWLTDIWFVDGCQIDQEVTNAVFVESNNASTLISNIHLEGLYVNKATDYAMAFTSTGSFGFIRDVWVNGCVFYQPQTAAITFAGADTVIRNVHVTDNTITDCASSGGAIVFNEVNGITCTGNVARQDIFTNMPDYLVEFQTGCEEIVCTGNKGVVGTDVTVGVVLDNSGTTVGKLIYGNVDGNVLTDNVVISAKALGIKGDGATDDTTALQAIIDAVAAAGGGAILVNVKCRIASNLTVKPNVFLVGEYTMPGRNTVGSGASTDYSTISSCLRVASTATITLEGGAGIEGLLVYRYGMVFPATPATTSTGFAGTAITVTGDDASVRSCLIMGFNKGVYASGVARLRIENVYHDNLNGIEITNCDDIPYLTNCHAWPFATIVSGQSWNNLIRSGTAYYLHDFVDWAKVTNCFSYGYAVGFKITAANSAVLSACGADNVFDTAPLHTGSIGYVVDGACYETKLIGCQSAAQDTAGVFVNVSDGLSTLVTGHTAWGCGSHGLLVNGGDVVVSGGAFRDVANGVTINDTISKVSLLGVTFGDALPTPVQFAVSSNSVQIKDCIYTDFVGQPVSSLLTAPSVASGASVLLPNNGNTFTITGTTSFGSLQHGWLGREVVLIFSGSLTVFNGTGSVTNMKLLGGANLSTGAGTVLKLVHNGTQWYETGRS